jgi:hypothetical protein
LWQYSEKLSRELKIVAQSLWTCYGRIEIRNGAVFPAPNLVATDSQSPGKSRSHRTLSDNTARGSPTVWDRCLFDHESTFGNFHDQC